MQLLHVRHQFATSLFIQCHMKHVLIRGFVALCDGWPKPWKLVKTRCFSGFMKLTIASTAVGNGEMPSEQT